MSFSPVASATSSSVGSRSSFAFSSRSAARDLALAVADVRRDPDRPGAVLDAALDRLADPEGRVGGELVALAPVELLGGADQPEDALLDEVEQRQVVGRVLLGERDDQAQVRVDQPLLGRRGRRARCAWRARPPRARSAAGSGAARCRNICSASVVTPATSPLRSAGRRRRRGRSRRTARGRGPRGARAARGTARRRGPPPAPDRTARRGSRSPRVSPAAMSASSRACTSGSIGHPAIGLAGWPTLAPVVLRRYGAAGPARPGGRA